MTRRRSLLILGLMALMLAGACWQLWRDYQDAEMKVYVAYLQSLNADPAMKDVAFMNRISSCGAAAAKVPPEYSDALRDLLRVNGADAAPRRLEKLAQLANVVRYEEARRLHAVQYREPSLARKRVIGLSRAGFDQAGDRAVLCVEFGYGRGLAFFAKADGPFWRLADFSMLQVQ